MIKRLLNYAFDLRDRQRMIIAITKGTAMMLARNVDLTRPGTWEFSGFSQNGEDGILDVLCRQLGKSNRYFVEIGASDGMENHSSWLVVAGKFHGIMIDANAKLVERARRVVGALSIGTECRHQFVTAENAKELARSALYLDPDVFSLDIDGNDYYVAKTLMDAGFRPKIVAVEYNSAYGPQRSLTIEYQDMFAYMDAHPSGLYYGVSVSGWRKFFEGRGYRFVTVDRSGVNAFFADPACFEPGFLDGVKGLEFAENRHQYTKFRKACDEQFAMIADLKFNSI